jgi:hypothetical protein
VATGEFSSQCIAAVAGAFGKSVVAVSHCGTQQADSVCFAAAGTPVSQLGDGFNAIRAAQLAFRLTLNTRNLYAKSAATVRLR